MEKFLILLDAMQLDCFCRSLDSDCMPDFLRTRSSSELSERSSLSASALLKHIASTTAILTRFCWLLNIEKHRMAALTCGSSEMDSQSSQDSCSRDGALSPVPSLTGSSASWSSSLSSLPTTPRSSSSHTLSRFASRDSLSLYSPDDKFTQIPMVSPRERRSSSATATARRRKSLASLSIGGGQSTTPTATPSRHLAPPLVPLEGKRLSRKHVEASRRSAKEALEEDLRALDLVGDTQDRSMVDDYACELLSLILEAQLICSTLVDCYLTSLDYLVKAWRTDTSDVKTRKAIRARLQVLSDSLITPEERADQIQQATTGPPNATSAPSQVDFGQSFFAPFAPLASFLREPAIRFLLLSAALLALQILSAFEVNQFGTDASKACLEHVEQLVSELRP